MQTTFSFASAVTVAALVLSGCIPESPCDAATPGNRVAAAGQMANCLNTLNATPVAMMPTSGTAIYNGYVTGQVTPAGGASDSLIGDASLTASFGTLAPVTGTLSNISAVSDSSLGGTLNVTSGPIVGNIFTANIMGTLTGYGVAGTTGGTSLAINTNTDPANGIVGGFLGDGADAILIATTGTVNGGGSADLAIVAQK